MKKRYALQVIDSNPPQYLSGDKSTVSVTHLLSHAHWFKKKEVKNFLKNHPLSKFQRITVVISGW